MKCSFIYRRWNILIFLNNLVSNAYLVSPNCIVYLKSDVNNFSCWIYSKKLIVTDLKILKLKNKFFWQ